MIFRSMPKLARILVPLGAVAAVAAGGTYFTASTPDGGTVGPQTLGELVASFAVPTAEAQGDTTPPVVVTTPVLPVAATSSRGANVTYQVAAIDETDPAPTVTCTPSSPSEFPIGDTTVSCTGRDAAGNTSAETFTVAVMAPDIDNDTVADYADNCPYHKNQTQADADGDGLGDACEAPVRDTTATIKEGFRIPRESIVARASLVKDSRLLISTTSTAWRTEFHPDTGAIRNLYGNALSVGQTVTRDNADDIARTLLFTNEDKFGIDPAALALSRIDESAHPYAGQLDIPAAAKVYQVYFDQHHRGLPVFSRTAVVTFANDRFTSLRSFFVPKVSVGITPAITRDGAVKIAREHRGLDARAVTAFTALGVFTSQEAPRLVFRIDLAGEIGGSVRVYVDAADGLVREVESLVKNAIKGNVTGPVAGLPGQANFVQPFAHEQVEAEDVTPNSPAKGSIIDGNTDKDGNYALKTVVDPSWLLRSSLKGKFVHVKSASAPRPDHSDVPDASFAQFTPPTNQVNWHWADFDPSPGDEQSNVYYRINDAHAFFTKGDPFNITGLDYPMPVHVDVKGKLHPKFPCMGNFDSVLEGVGGITLNGASRKYQDGNGNVLPCPQGGLSNHTLYHEYTHAVLGQVYKNASWLSIVDPLEHCAIQEGFPDYFASTILNGGGSKNTKKYPEDFLVYDLLNEDHGCHANGDIIEGVAWDFRETPGIGATIADAVVMRALKYNPFKFKEVIVDMLKADDPDGNFSTPPPHIKEICNAAYTNHGIVVDECYGYTSIPIAEIVSPTKGQVFNPFETPPAELKDFDVTTSEQFPSDVLPVTVKIYHSELSPVKTWKIEIRTKGTNTFTPLASCSKGEADIGLCQWVTPAGTILTLPLLDLLKSPDAAYEIRLKVVADDGTFAERFVRFFRDQYHYNVSVTSPKTLSQTVHISDSDVNGSFHITGKGILFCDPGVTIRGNGNEEGIGVQMSIADSPLLQGCFVEKYAMGVRVEDSKSLNVNNSVVRFMDAVTDPWIDGPRPSTGIRSVRVADVFIQSNTFFEVRSGPPIDSSIIEVIEGKEADIKYNTIENLNADFELVGISLSGMSDKLSEIHGNNVIRAGRAQVAAWDSVEGQTSIKNNVLQEVQGSGVNFGWAIGDGLDKIEENQIAGVASVLLPNITPDGIYIGGTEQALLLKKNIVEEVPTGLVVADPYYPHKKTQFLIGNKVVASDECLRAVNPYRVIALLNAFSSCKIGIQLSFSGFNVPEFDKDKDLRLLFNTIDSSETGIEITDGNEFGVMQIVGNTVTSIGLVGIKGTNMQKTLINKNLIHNINFAQPAQSKIQGTGILINFPSGDELKGNGIGATEQAIAFFGTPSDVKVNKIAGNVTFASKTAAIFLKDTSPNIVERNVLSLQGTGISSEGSSSASGNAFNINTIVKSSQGGIAVHGSMPHGITGNTVTTAKVGIEIGPLGTTLAAGNQVISNTVKGNFQSGGIVVNGNQNKIFNNHILDSSGLHASDNGTGNAWFVTPGTVPGNNIVGGPAIGGNFYFGYTGVDADGDGFGDTPFAIPGTAGAVDNFPLVQ